MPENKSKGDVFKKDWKKWLESINRNTTVVFEGADTRVASLVQTRAVELELKQGWMARAGAY